MFECPVTTTTRAQMYDVIKASVNGESNKVAAVSEFVL
jgi:hypothetical protein